MSKIKAIIIALVVLLIGGSIAIFAFKGDKTYTVTFDSNGGTKVEKQEIKENKKVEEPEDPTKEGYNFKGWFLDGKKYDFDKKVTKDIKLKAKWSKVTVSEEEVESYLPVFNTVVQPVAKPTVLPVEKKPATLTLELPTEGFINEPIEFTVETVANDDKGLEALGTLSFSNILAIANLEYYDEEDDAWYGLALLEEEIELQDNVRKFRITLSEECELTITYSLLNPETREVLLSDFKTILAEKEEAEVSITIPEKVYVGDVTEFSITTMANGYAGTMVVGTGGLSDETAIDTLEYYEIQDGQWYDLPLGQEFGPATGFPLTDNATSNFRVSFKTAGTYTVTFKIVDVATREVLAENTKTITVELKPAEVSITIPEKVYVGDVTEFSITTMANGYAGTMVVGTGGLSDETAIDTLEYYEIQDGQWYDLPLGQEFGPATGFPLTDNATSNFRVSFKTAGTYTVTFKIVDVATREVLAENTKTITVEEQPTIPAPTPGA